eukprot:TRINITY_DN121298_c0_g1_i1.p1 TRINITY_DN121298_c0_g1~~TRINITY_DN121298_c0_g1_i1.p1  ORF type:complete len:404 (+),score=28.98 TRINITY_DN121298_c0_g1_i1:120-1331(+)
MKALTLLLLLSIVYSKVQFVAEVVRNGISTPNIRLSFFPDITFSMLDELTASGLRQLYLLGRLRRSQFIENSSELPFDYESSKVYARSTDARKTLMSAQAYLLGLYPTGLAPLNDNQTQQATTLLVPPVKLNIGEDLIRLLGKQALPRNIPLIPVYSVNQTAERMLQVGDCPYYESTINAYFISEEYKKLRAEFESVWKVIKSSYPQITEQYLATGKSALVLAEYLVSVDLMGKRPDKLTNEVITGLKQFIGKATKAQVLADPILQKIAISELSNDLLARMNQTLAGKPTASFALYVGHEHVLASLLLGLKSFNNSISFETTDFASNVLLEMGTDESTYVAIYYNGMLVHKEDYATFKEKLAKASDIGTTWENACMKNSAIIKANLRESLKEQCLLVLALCFM